MSIKFMKIHGLIALCSHLKNSLLLNFSNLQVTLVKSQTVADIVQAQRMTQLGENHGNDMVRRRKTPRLYFVLVLQFFDKFFRNVLDNLSQHHHIMLLRSHVSILWLVAEKKVAWDLFFVKSENFLWDSSEKK